jgi:hypothetical protein
MGQTAELRALRLNLICESRRLSATNCRACGRSHMRAVQTTSASRLESTIPLVVSQLRLCLSSNSSRLYLEAVPLPQP